MLRKGRGKPEALSSESELGPAHAVCCFSSPSSSTMSLVMELWYSFFLNTGGFSPFFTYTRVTSNGRSRSGWLRTFQHVLLLVFLPSSSVTCLVTCCCYYYYCCSYGNALKMCQKLSSHESSESLSFPSRKGRWLLFSLGAGNVVYHHLLLYVRNWVVSLVGGCWLFYLFMG